MKQIWWTGNMRGVEKSAVCYKVLRLQRRVFVLLVQVN